jgi:hypothetical protein
MKSFGFRSSKGLNCSRLYCLSGVNLKIHGVDALAVIAGHFFMCREKSLPNLERQLSKVLQAAAFIKLLD